MRKPSAVLHMTAYGLIYGLLLAMLYIWGYITLIGTAEFGSLNETLGAMGFVGYFAFIFGALPGGVMGFVEGWLLWFLTRNVNSPISDAQYTRYTRARNVSLGIIGTITVLAMASMLSVLFGFPIASSGDSFFWVIFAFLPALVAGGASMYAVNRYMLKLRAWANVGKAKNDYKLKNQLAVNNAAHAETPVSAENAAQVNRLRQ